MVTFTSVNGAKTKQMVTESTSITMVLCTRAPGRMISSMDVGLRPGWTVPAMKVITLMDASMVKVTLLGKMVQAILASFSTTTSKVRVCTNGSMDESTKVTGKRTKCMAMASSNGKMVDNIKVAL